MKPLRWVSLFIAVSLIAAVKSPDDRPITDPKSLNSRSNPAAAPIAIDQLFYTRAVKGPSWSPDGREIVFTTNLTGRLNLWKVSANGGWPVQLSQSDDREMQSNWSPDGKWIVYQQDSGGGEYYDLFALPSKGGEAINLTGTKDISETGALWSPDSKTIAFARKLKSSAASNVAVMNWSTREVAQLTHEKDENFRWQPVVWSRDGRYIFALRSNASFTDSSVYRIDFPGGKTEELTPHTGEIRYSVSSITPDGSTALVSSKRERRIRQYRAARCRFPQVDLGYRTAVGSATGRVFSARRSIHVSDQPGRQDRTVSGRPLVHACLPNQFSGGRLPICRPAFVLAVWRQAHCVAPEFPKAGRSLDRRRADGFVAPVDLFGAGRSRSRKDSAVSTGALSQFRR